MYNDLSLVHLIKPDVDKFIGTQMVNTCFMTHSACVCILLLSQSYDHLKVPLVCFTIQSQDIIIRHLVTLTFKSMHFQIFAKNNCRKTIEATIMKKVPNESKLIYTINIFIVAS